MRQCVHAAGGGQLRWHRDRQQRIVDDDARQHPRVAPGDLLTLIGLPPDRGHLAAGVRGGNGEDGQSAIPSHSLRESGRGAAAYGDDDADSSFTGRLDGLRGNLERHMLHDF